MVYEIKRNRKTLEIMFIINKIYNYFKIIQWNFYLLLHFFRVEILNHYCAYYVDQCKCNRGIQKMMRRVSKWSQSFLRLYISHAGTSLSTVELSKFKKTCYTNWSILYFICYSITIYIQSTVDIIMVFSEKIYWSFVVAFENMCNIRYITRNCACVQYIDVHFFGFG